MTPSLYPPHLRSLFTNRERELAILEQATRSLSEGRPRHLALFGLRRIGKTLLLMEHLTRLVEQGPSGRVRPVYIDMEELVTSPELFSRRYVGLTTYWALTGGQGDRDSYLTPTGLLSGPAAGLRCVAQTLATVESARDDPALQVSAALEFPEKLAAELGCYLLMLLDEFTELAVLGNYPAVRRPIQLFRAVLQRQGRLGYIIAASAISAMQHLVQDGQSPLFLQFESMEVARFPLDATLALIERVVDATPATSVARRLHELTGGHPFYVFAVASRLDHLRTEADAVTIEDAERAFVLETLTRDGRIYNYCRYLYDISLSRARGYGILKAILQTLADEEGLALSEIARRIHKSAPGTRGYLRALQEVDLLIEDGKEYYYRDPVLRYWVAAMTRGIEVDTLASRAALAPLLVDLEAQHARLSSELGRARESQLRETLRGFAGQTVDGAWLGKIGPMTLPIIQDVAPYRSVDGQVEVDALAKVENDKKWAVELKWQNKAVGEKELALLAAKAATLNARPWCISRSGFTPAARAYADANDILISTRNDFDKVEKAIRSTQQEAEGR